MADGKPSRLRAAFAVWTRLVPYLAPHRRRLLVASLLTLVAVAVELLKPWPIKVVIDQVLLGTEWPLLPDWLRDKETLTTAAIVATVLLAVLGGVAGAWCSLRLADAGQRAVGKVRGDALDAVLRQSLSFHERHRAGDLLVRLCSDAASLRTLLVEGLFSLGREALMVLGTLVVMLLVDWRLATAAVLVLPVIGLLMALFAVRLRTAARKQRKKEGQLAAAAHETLAAVPVIQAYGLEEVAAHDFTKQNRRSARAGLQATRLEGRLGLATDTALAIGTAFVLMLGIGRVQAGALTPGELIVLLAYVRSFYRPIRKGLGRSAAMVKAAAAGERVLELLDAPESLTVPALPKHLTQVRGEVTFRDVHFHHESGREVLCGVDLVLAAGEHVALVGGNGAGKTTLASLLPRLRDPQRGAVLLDGTDVRHLDPAELRRHVAVVFQESVLFDGTLLENVRLGRPDADSEQVLAAARMAGVLEFAGRLPEGLDTRVGERGADLSGGERQRTAIARALLRDPKVFVFDEPTTGLDATAEQRLCEVVLPGLRGRTVLLITHNPRVLEAVHRVVRLHDGRIATGDPTAPSTELASGGAA